MASRAKREEAPIWHLEGKPYEVQTVAQQKAKRRRGYGYFLEQGLGKTPLTLNEYVELCMREKCDSLVVVCMFTMMDDWQDAASDWTAGEILLSIWPDVTGADGLIMNYETLLYSGGEFLAKYLKSHQTMLVLDDSSRIKNPSAQTTRWVLAYAHHATFVRLLNGTPMTQSVMDLYPQFRALGALEGVNRYAFRNKYAEMGGYMGKVVLGVKDEVSLQRLLEAWSFRALKTDWSDIPDKIYVNRRIRMTKVQQGHYDQMLRDFYLLLTDGSEVSARYVITQAEKLQQISSGFVLDDDGRAHDIVPPKKNPKLRAVCEYLEITEGKVIIAVLHRHAIDLLLETIPGDVAVIRGKRDMRLMERTSKEEKRRFNNDPECRYIVLQIQSGAFGHTLLGQKGRDRCAATIHFENSYSLLLRSQVEDRNHRFGQDTPPYHLDLIASPIEAKAVNALKRKKDLAQAIVDAVRAIHDEP